MLCAAHVDDNYARNHQSTIEEDMNAYSAALQSLCSGNCPSVMDVSSNDLNSFLCNDMKKKCTTSNGRRRVLLQAGSYGDYGDGDTNSPDECDGECCLQQPRNLPTPHHILF